MANTTREFIQAVKEYRQNSGSSLKDSVRYVEKLILAGKVDFKKYEDPSLSYSLVKPVMKLLNGDVIYVGYPDEKALSVSISVDPNENVNQEGEIFVLVYSKEKGEHVISFSQDEFARLTPYFPQK